MKKLDKRSKDYLLKMIQDGDKMRWIIAYCEGLGIDTDNYSSPVTIKGNKISITYRNVNSYYYAI
jgi:hypothetical protein